MERSKYKRLKKIVQEDLSEQIKKNPLYAEVSVGLLRAVTGFPEREIEAALPALAKDCGVTVERIIGFNHLVFRKRSPWQGAEDLMINPNVKPT